ncbi:MAG: tyrosine-type recombinase/integrase, partial [Planctomycetes bacterium]|nr:tyrosine-type recombinase/integrase [Planctomycetota bacterium]
MNKVKVWLLKRKGKRGLSYAIQWVDVCTGKRITRAVGPDRAYARQKHAEKRKELLKGLHTEITAISYDKFAADHLEQIANSLSKGSYLEHKHALRRFKEVCHPQNLTVINFSMLEKFRNARVKDGVRPATVNKSLITMQSILERAVKRGYLAQNPFKGNRKALFVSEPEPTPRILELGEFDKIFAACPDDRWRGICLVAYHGGLRRGEITALRWSDVNFDEGTLRICNTPDHKTKNRRVRLIPMSKQVVLALRKLQLGMFRAEYVFLNARGRRIVSNFDSQFRRIVRRSGLVDEQGKPRFSAHDLRRSCATEMLRRGVH